MRSLLSFILLFIFSVSAVHGNQLENAENLLRQGDTDGALSVVNKVLKQSPKIPEARFLKGLILVEQGNTTQAIAVFTALTRDYPELPEPYNNLAVIYAAEGDYDRARDALQSALKTHPSYSTAYENLGDIYAKLASEAYQQALDLEKDGADGLRVKLSLIDEMFVNGADSASVAAVDVRSPPAVIASVEPEPLPEVIERNVVANAPVATQVVAEPVEQAPNPNVMQFVDEWSRAWSSQNVEDYLSFYASSFKPAKGSSAKWRMQRHIRLKRPDYIRITLSDISFVDVNDERVRVDFTQKYESNTYSDVDRKRLDIILVDGQWKIFREKSI